MVTTIADLEIYGLSLRTINFLEDDLGAIYLDDLRDVTETIIEDNCHWGACLVIRELRVALKNHKQDTPVRTVHDCIYCCKPGGDDAH